MKSCFRALMLALLAMVSLPSTLLAQVEMPKETSVHFGSLTNNLIRPGFNVGLERNVLNKVVLKTVKRGNTTVPIVKMHQVILAANAGLIWHPRTSTTLLNTYTVEYRKTGRHRMQYQLGFGPGYYFSFLPNVYEVDENGTVEKKFISGKGFPVATSFIGYGRYRAGAHTLQWWHLRISDNLILGYNSFVLPYLTAELRLGFHKKPIG